MELESFKVWWNPKVPQSQVQYCRGFRRRKSNFMHPDDRNQVDGKEEGYHDCSLAVLGFE
jgi:hypothetical protein